MKAFIYKGKGDLSIREVNRPELRDDGALAKILYASICGTDIRTYRHGNDHILPPRIIGHEALYLLEEVSPNLKDHFKKGDKVIVAPAIGCGECPSCRRGKTNMCNHLKTIGFEYEGTFSEYCIIPKQAFIMNNVIKVGGEIHENQASLAEPIACAINGQRFLSIQPNENVLIFGAGFLGCIHAELALASGANKVIIAEVSQPRRAQVEKSLPEVVVIDPPQNELPKLISDITAGSGVDVVITACPVGSTHKQALEIINRSGRISLFGGLPGQSTGFLDSNLIHYKEVGVFGVHASTPAQNLEALNMLEKGMLHVEKYISEFPFDEIDQAFQALFLEKAVKAVLKM